MQVNLEVEIFRSRVPVPHAPMSQFPETVSPKQPGGVREHQQTWQTLYFLIFSSLFKLFVNYLTLYNVGPKII